MKASKIAALLFLTFTVYWTFKSLIPTYQADKESSLNEFSVDRAFEHVKHIAQKPHAVGFEAHKEVREYILQELRNLGLRPFVQEGFTAGDWGNVCRAKNILARIEGESEGKALLLLSHYDSNPHSSFGASDAASGVATILEGIRAYLENGAKPKNDIIILFSDAEELGLNGAELFVNQHEWSKDVGLVLNFEARGSGGPSYMLIETNRGNQNLINEFVKARPDYPVANSLAYSIYKMLPNDTDLTVFREDADIEGFNFAFIDDHFDYHTALDRPNRLDKNSLAHQGSYLMPLLHHFSSADLNNLKSLNDNVYFNVPFFGLVSYPYDWIWPLYVLAILCFVAVLFRGFKKKKLSLIRILKGLLPMFITLLVTGAMGYTLWPFLTWWYPWFNDILHGFAYMGHAYIASLALSSLAVCLLVYKEFDNIKLPNLLVGPLIFWFIACAVINTSLLGASFFIVPLFTLLIAFYVSINQEKPSSFLLAFLALPAIAIFAPFIKMFPVGLGLKMMTAGTLFVTFVFFFALPFFKPFKQKRLLAALLLLIAFFFALKAHMNSAPTDIRPKPSSLAYVLDADSKTAQWATYDHVRTPWNATFFNDSDSVKNDKVASTTISSKYNTRFKKLAEAPLKPIAGPEIMVELDTLINDKRKLKLCILSERNLNRLDIFSNTAILSAKINGLALSEFYLKQRRGNKLATHYVSDNENTDLELELPKSEKLELIVYEASNDLLEHDLFSIPPRPENEIPMPFVLNDAIIVKKTITLE